MLSFTNLIKVQTKFVLILASRTGPTYHRVLAVTIVDDPGKIIKHDPVVQLMKEAQ